MSEGCSVVYVNFGTGNTDQELINAYTVDGSPAGVLGDPHPRPRANAEPTENRITQHIRHLPSGRELVLYNVAQGKVANHAYTQPNPIDRTAFIPILKLEAMLHGHRLSDTATRGVVSIDSANVLAAGDRQTRSCGRYHCWTLRTCDGREHPMGCTVLATCANGVAQATGFTW